MRLRKLAIVTTGLFTSLFTAAQLPAVIADSLDYYEPFKTAFTPAWKKGMCGLINARGETVLPFRYNTLELMGSYGVVAFQFGDYRFLDFSGKPLFDFPLSYFQSANDSLGYGKKPDGDEWYILNFKTRTVTVLNNAVDFSYNGEGLFKVIKKNQRGYQLLRCDGSVLLPFSLQTIYKAANGRFAAADSNGKYYLFTTKGQRISFPSAWSELFPADESNKIFFYRVNGQTGMADGQLHPILPASYNYITPVSNSFLYLLQKGTSFGVASAKGAVILPCNSPDKCQMVNEAQTFFSVVSPAGAYGLTSQQNKRVLPCVYESMLVKNKAAAVKDKQGWRLFGLQQRSWLSNEYFEDLHWGAGNYFLVKKNGKWGVVDEEMKQVIPAEYDDMFESAFWPGSRRVFTVKKNNRTGIINEKNEVLVPLIYYFIDGSFMSPGCAWAMKDTAYGVINTRNEEVIPFVYDNYEFRNAGEIKVTRSGKTGMIDCGGNILVALQYENVRTFSQGMAAVCQNRKWGYINKKGELLIPCIYDDAGFFLAGKALVKKEGRLFYINMKGEEVKQ